VPTIRLQLCKGFIVLAPDPPSHRRVAVTSHRRRTDRAEATTGSIYVGEEHPASLRAQQPNLRQATCFPREGAGNQKGGRRRAVRHAASLRERVIGTLGPRYPDHVIRVQRKPAAHRHLQSCMPIIIEAPALGLRKDKPEPRWYMLEEAVVISIPGLAVSIIRYRAARCSERHTQSLRRRSYIPHPRRARECMLYYRIEFEGDHAKGHRITMNATRSPKLLCKFP